MSENNVKTPLNAKEELNMLVNLAYRALKVKPKIIVNTTEISINDSIREDFFLPVIVAMTNTLGRTLLDGPKGMKAFSTILPFEVNKDMECLCFLGMQEISDSMASKTLRSLLLMQVLKSIFIDPMNTKTNVVDLSDLVKGWRNTMMNIPEGRIISPDTIALKLIQQNMKVISSTATNLIKSTNS